MKKTIKSFGFAGRGIRFVFGTETNMKIHLVVCVLVIVCGFIFQISLTEWLICLLCIGLVIGMEMINTSIENIVDLVSPNHHPLAGKAKDIAAGAVLICVIISVVIGLLIFVPKVLTLLVSMFQ
ncbi:MAG: diacylglycerol kinase family protein [Paludibacter sp.]